MSHSAKPHLKPACPNFSSGPCAKRPGWSPEVLIPALTGRSHRSDAGLARLKLAIDKTRDILALPPGYEIAILSGSDTGAFEGALWNMLGARGVDVFAWDAFGRIWLRDALHELKLADLRTFDAPWGHLPDLAQADFTRDVIFTWNGTTSGVRVPDAKWIADNRQGLTFVDATSALFAENIDFSKVDVLSFSWQKGLGGEAAHGMLILSPRAIQRLESYRPAWPVPKLFRMTNADGVLPGLFEGVTINTPSMLCVEDYLDALQWVERTGGQQEAIARSHANAKVIYDWMAHSSWAAPLAVDPATRSNTSVCLRLADAGVLARGNAAALHFTGEMAALLEAEGVAYDIASYRGVTPGLRVWTGATIEARDLERLLPWLDWAFSEIKARQTS